MGPGRDGIGQGGCRDDINPPRAARHIFGTLGTLNAARVGRDGGGRGPHATALPAKASHDAFL